MRDLIERPSGLAAYPYAVTAIAAALIVVVAYAIGATVLGVEESSRILSAGSSAAAISRPNVGREIGLTTTGKATLDGNLQRIDIDASATQGLTPNHLVLKAGVPCEMRFSRGRAGFGVLRVENVGIAADIGQGPTMIRLPPLGKGIYAVTVDRGSVVGLIVVE